MSKTHNLIFLNKQNYRHILYYNVVENLIQVDLLHSHYLAIRLGQICSYNYIR